MFGHRFVKPAVLLIFNESGTALLAFWDVFTLSVSFRCATVQTAPEKMTSNINVSLLMLKTPNELNLWQVRPNHPAGGRSNRAPWVFWQANRRQKQFRPTTIP